jgi:hypothetical protein
MRYWRGQRLLKFTAKLPYTKINDVIGKHRTIEFFSVYDSRPSPLYRLSLENLLWLGSLARTQASRPIVESFYECFALFPPRA